MNKLFLNTLGVVAAVAFFGLVTVSAQTSTSMNSTSTTTIITVDAELRASLEMAVMARIE
jgi:hypothetical protein